MKLSKREKTLITIFILAALIYVVYTYVPYDEFFKLSALEEEYSEKKVTYETMSKNIIMKTNYEKREQELTDEINNISMLNEIHQEQVIVFMNKYLSDHNIDSSNISFTEDVVIPVKTTIAGEDKLEKSTFESVAEKINNTTKTESTAESSTEVSDAQTENKEAKKEGLTIRSMTVNFAFESTYNDLLNFIDAIQNNKIDISITNINTVSVGGDLLQGSMALNFYAVPKLEGYTEKNEDWIWEDFVTGGKSNPFLLNSSSVPAFSNSSNFDFYISLKPESSDLPTVIVGKAEDKNRTTYVYADSNTMEDIEFEFKKESDKYFYKYSTRNSTYPTGRTYQEFMPSDNDSIFIKIYSTERNAKTDSAGANINVTNTTGLKIRFEIEDDDTTNPRVYFKDPKSVIVTRK